MLGKWRQISEKMPGQFKDCRLVIAMTSPLLPFPGFADLKIRVFEKTSLRFTILLPQSSEIKRTKTQLR